MNSARSENQSDGNYRVNAFGGEPGNLSVEGNLGVEEDFDVGGFLQFGTTTETVAQPAIKLAYSEGDGGNLLNIDASRNSTSLLFRDNVGTAARTKFVIDGDNVVKLYDGGGAVGLVLSPASGIVIGQGRSITLGDGTVLSGMSSLKSSVLYDMAGASVVSVNGSGNVGVGSVGVPTARLSVRGSSIGNVADFYSAAGDSVASIQSTGGLAVGTSTNTGTARLLLKGGASGGALLFGMLDANGVQVASFDHGGTLRLNGSIYQSNPYNYRVFTIYSGAGSIDLNDVLHLNRGSASDVVLAYGGGRVSVGTYSASARLEVFNKGSVNDAVIRAVGASGQVGNLLEVQAQSGSKNLIVSAGGNVGVGTQVPAAKLDVTGDSIMRGKLEITGSVKFPRQGDILMGEFGNAGD